MDSITFGVQLTQFKVCRCIYRICSDRTWGKVKMVHYYSW